MAVGILGLIWFLTNYGPKPPGVIDHGAKPIIYRNRTDMTELMQGTKTNSLNSILRSCLSHTYLMSTLCSAPRRSFDAAPENQLHPPYHDIWGKTAPKRTFLLEEIKTKIWNITLILYQILSTVLGRNCLHVIWITQCRFNIYFLFFFLFLYQNGIYKLLYYLKCVML